MTVFRLDRDVVMAEGPDAISFLQGQLSADVTRLAVGDSAFSFVLQPTGKVVALVRCTRIGGNAVAIDVDAGWGPVVIERLERFKLRTRCELTQVPWGVVHVSGEEARGPWLVASETGSGVEVLGPVDELPRADGDAMAYEAARIAAGVPRMGSELTEDTIPAEAGPAILGRSVSFTKGCYTGQELVARIDSRGGNVPRQIRVVHMEGPDLPPVGAVVSRDEGDVGRLTSVALTRSDGPFAVALASIQRGTQAPAEVVVRWADGEARGFLPGEGASDT